MARSCGFVRPDRPGPGNRFPDLAIRDAEWKLLIHRDGSDVQLFNINEDPAETRNLAVDHRNIVERLKKQVIQWDQSIGH